MLQFDDAHVIVALEHSLASWHMMLQLEIVELHEMCLPLNELISEVMKYSPLELAIPIACVLITVAMNIINGDNICEDIATKKSF